MKLAEIKPTTLPLDRFLELFPGKYAWYVGKGEWEYYDDIPDTAPVARLSNISPDFTPVIFCTGDNNMWLHINGTISPLPQLIYVGKDVLLGRQ